MVKIPVPPRHNDSFCLGVPKAIPHLALPQSAGNRQTERPRFFAGDAEPEKITMNGKRLRYFSDSSYVVFTPGGKVEKGTFSGARRLRFDFSGN